MKINLPPQVSGSEELMRILADPKMFLERLEQLKAVEDAARSRLGDLDTQDKIIAKENAIARETERLAALEARLIEKDNRLIERDKALQSKAQRIAAIAAE